MDLSKLVENALSLCHEIEKLPASDQQTNVSIRASELHAELRRIVEPAVELKDCLPLVMYFGNDKDRLEFVEAVKMLKPGMVARKL